MTIDLQDALLGAALGAVVSGIFAGTATLAKWLWNRRPLRLFLDDLGDDDRTLSFFVRDMVSADGQYYSITPAGERRQWQNTQVVGRADAEAVTDIVNLLGQAGRARNFAWRNLFRDWDLWSDPFVCVGGSFKADKALDLCRPALVRFMPADAFVTIADGRTFRADKSHDFGLIYRGRHPETGVSCLIVFGLGVQGTEAAGSYLRRRGRMLARLYGPETFAVIIKVGWDDGRDSGTLVWSSPISSRFRRFLYPLTWLQYRKAPTDLPP